MKSTGKITKEIMKRIKMPIMAGGTDNASNTYSIHVPIQFIFKPSAVLKKTTYM
jgi:hypothetical protein